MTNTKVESYQVGDVIEYKPFGGGTRVVRVTERDADVKNGRPGFTGKVRHGGGGVWGYDEQIVALVAWKDCPDFDELPVRARFDLTGVNAAEYGVAPGQTHAEVVVSAFHQAASGRRYGRILWQDENFMVAVSDLDFDV